MIKNNIIELVKKLCMTQGILGMHGIYGFYSPGKRLHMIYEPVSPTIAISWDNEMVFIVYKNKISLFKEGAEWERILEDAGRKLNEEETK